MAIYEYECQNCGVFEYTQKMSDPALKECPVCAEKGQSVPVQKLISASAFHLKGGGWYKTDFAGKSSTNNCSTCPDKKEGCPSTESKSETSSSESSGCKSGCACHSDK